MKQTVSKNVQKMVLSALFLAIGLVLPFLTGQIPKIGNMLCPMHIPVLLCGLICGWQYGATMGFVLPLLRFTLFFAPPMPNCIAMAFELMAYGLVVGLLYARSKWQCIRSLYRCLLIAMIAGRLVWGGAMVVITGAAGTAFGWKMFLAGALFNAIPGIILQLVFIPAFMVALNRTGMVPFHRPAPQPAED